jgi:hypothetical protein
VILAVRLLDAQVVLLPLVMVRFLVKLQQQQQLLELQELLAFEPQVPLELLVLELQVQLELLEFILLEQLELLEFTLLGRLELLGLQVQQEQQV